VSSEVLNSGGNSAKALVVIGMHRSGTSALAGLLNHLGIEMGSSLMPAQEAVNEKGFWEQEAIVSIHDRLLQYLGLSWDDPRHLAEGWWLEDFPQQCLDEICSVLTEDMKTRSLWAIKDPRMCRLLPLWHLVFSRLGIEPCFLCIVRNPLEVAASLSARDSMPEDLAILLWFQHNLEAIVGTVGYKRRFLEYGQLLDQGERLVRRILEEFSIKFEPSTTVSNEEEWFLTTNLRHHNVSAAELDSKEKVPGIVKTLFNKLTVAAETGADLMANDLQAIRQQYFDVARLLQPWLRLSDKLQRDIASRNIAFEHLRRENELQSQGLRTAEETIRSMRIQSSAIDSALKEAQQIVGDKEVRERQLDTALREAQGIVKERGVQMDELNRALEKATGYVRDREADVNSLNAKVEGLERYIGRIEKHWLLGYVTKNLMRSAK
jgi:hypothetical protein